MNAPGTFPAIDSNLSTDALVAHVIALYPVGPVVRCRLHTRGLNDTYKVETRAGETYFLRVYLAGGRSRAEIETEIQVLRHLAGKGLNVSVPVCRSDRQVLMPLDCVEGRRWAALFTAAPGREVHYKAYTEDLAGLYGRAVAAIHGAADSYPGRPERPPLDLASLLIHPLSRVISAISHRGDDASYVEALGERLQRAVEASTPPEIGFCHGDLHGQNACEQDGIFTFYDFDCSGWGYRAYEVAVFPWVFALQNQEPARIEAMARAYLTGYLGRRALNPADIAMIPAFVAIREIWLMGLHIGIGDRAGWDWINDSYFDRHLKVLRDWEDAFLGRPYDDWLPTRADEGTR